jgi:hypothetical protein
MCRLAFTPPVEVRTQRHIMMSGNDVRTPRQLSTCLPLMLCWLVFNGVFSITVNVSGAYVLHLLPQVMGMMRGLCLIPRDFLHVMAYSPVVVRTYAGCQKDEPFCLHPAVRLLLPWQITSVSQF